MEKVTEKVMKKSGMTGIPQILVDGAIKRAAHWHCEDTEEGAQWTLAFASALPRKNVYELTVTGSKLRHTVKFVKEETYYEKKTGKHFVAHIFREVKQKKVAPRTAVKAAPKK